MSGGGGTEAEILRELAADCGAATALVVAPACNGPLRALRSAGPGRATIVLLHGRGHAAPVWFPCWRALAARHPILAFDLPGFGASGHGEPAPAAADPEAALRFFADPVESALLAERGAAELVLVGHSLGGLVALELALRGRVPVSRLVLIDAMGLGPDMTFGGRAFFRLHPERLERVLGRRLFGRLNPASLTPDGRRLADLEHELFTARLPARRFAARAFDRLCPLRGPVFSRRERLDALSLPVLIVWGDRDPALPAANAVGAQQRMPRSQLIRFPTLGHSPHLEAPGEVVAPLLSFVE